MINLHVLFPSIHRSCIVDQNLTPWINMSLVSNMGKVALIFVKNITDV